MGAFQSTHPRGVRPKPITYIDAVCYFNPRTHVGCDASKDSTREHLSISIHAPTWGATRSRSRPVAFRLISIHAPTWGATAVQSNEPARSRISIHAPTWGATITNTATNRVRIDFNPRTHVGCDQIRCIMEHACAISIHAPTWGATVKPSNGWLLGHKDNEFANENIIIINSVNIT